MFDNWIPTLAGLLSSGGAIGAYALWKKINPEVDKMYLENTKTALEIISDSLQKEIARKDKYIDELEKENAELRSTLKR